MTNEELDRARARQAMQTHGDNHALQAQEAARLAREGWTPPVAVDPDLAEAQDLALWAESNEIFRSQLAHEALKRGRPLAAAEAKPGMVWKKWDGKGHGGDLFGEYVWVKYTNGTTKITEEEFADWSTVTHYAIITQPEDAA